MDWKQRAADLWADVKRYGSQALREWGEAIQNDPIQHLFSFAAGVVLAIGIFAAL